MKFLYSGGMWLNPLPASLIVAAFAWHTPPLPQEQVVSDPLSPETIAVVDQGRITLRHDWPNWSPQLTCTIVVKAVGAVQRNASVTYSAKDYRVRPSCGYVFGRRHRGDRTARAPYYYPPNFLPQ